MHKQQQQPQQIGGLSADFFTSVARLGRLDGIKGRKAVNPNPSSPAGHVYALAYQMGAEARAAVGHRPLEA